MSRPNFPFTAIVGQARFKLALILATLNPSIGGVLISGPRGSAKSTLARSLADVAQASDSEPSSFVTLPLGATEEMLVGTLNLQDVLKEQKVAFQEGLLAKADGGTLYVDEVNLLPDNLVDLLLDVAASGINVVERDGISHQHSAQFLLLGTMNPDEGELRPQLQDRFGFSVSLTNEYSIEDRVSIVRLREIFDADPDTFIEQYESQQLVLTQRIARAKENMALIECSDEFRTMIAKRCQEANVEGLRADIVWCRAAIAHAAWRGSALGSEDALARSQDKINAVSKEDLLAVEELVLSHRRKAGAPNSPPDSSQNSPPDLPKQPPFSRPPSRSPSHLSEEQNKNESSTRSNSDQQQRNQTENNGQGDWGKMEPQAQAIEKSSSVLSKKLTKPPKIHDVGSSDTFYLSNSSRKGHTAISAKGRRGVRDSSSIDWFTSLVANVGRWPLAQLRYRKAKAAQAVVHLILLDTSASTLQGQLLGHAKAVIVAITEQAYLKREQLTIVGFGNQQVETLLPQKKAPKALHVWLDTVTAAGGTPLQEVLEQALAIQQKHYRQRSNSVMKTYLITDGRTTQRFDDKPLLGEVMVIDTEQSTVKRGKAKAIAQALNADYFALST